MDPRLTRSRCRGCGWTLPQTKVPLRRDRLILIDAYLRIRIVRGQIPRRQQPETEPRVARSVVTDVLVGQVSEVDPDTAEHRFVILRTDDNRYLELDGEHLNANPNSRGFHHYFSARVRLLVASHSKEFVFLHAGVVAWKGKCVLFPADSHEGKTTLVAALISKGAVYYSDDYAIIDSEGLVHPFPRKLSIRDRDRPGRMEDVQPTLSRRQPAGNRSRLERSSLPGIQPAESGETGEADGWIRTNGNYSFQHFSAKKS